MQSTREWSRAGCCSVLAAALWPLSAYPTPGSQFEVATFPVVLALLIGLSDLLSESSRARSAGKLQMAIVGLLGVALLTLGYRDLAYSVRRSGMTPLDLPGAYLLRLDSETARQQQWLAQTLRENCETFTFSQHGHNRFYFWSELPPPTAKNPTFWPFLLSAADQNEIVAALQDHDELCLVEEEYAADLPEQDAPLSDYLKHNFDTLASFDGWVVKKRKSPLLRVAQ